MATLPATGSNGNPATAANGYGTPSRKQVKVVYETNSGDHRTRTVEIVCLPGDTVAHRMNRASDEYRRKYGFQTRVVAIHLN